MKLVQLHENLPGDYDWFYVDQDGNHNIKHSEYQEMIKDWPVPKLKHVLQDARQAIKANPDNPKNSVYQDEIHYIAMELKKRKDGNSR